MRDQFLEYIESRPSSANSGSNYISGINAISERFLKFDLFKIASAQEVQSIILELKNNKDFMQANTKGHNMYLRAIKHYMEFLLEPNQKSVLKKIQSYKYSETYCNRDAKNRNKRAGKD